MPIENDNKLDPRLKLMFAQAANGDIPMDTQIHFMMRAREGLETDHAEIRTRIGDIMTASATLEQIEELVKDQDVYYIQGARPLYPDQNL